MAYLLSLGLGLLVGVGYALLGVRSPAPPIVALVGLLGMVAGEQGALMARQAMAPVRGDHQTGGSGGAAPGGVQGRRPCACGRAPGMDLTDGCGG